MTMNQITLLAKNESGEPVRVTFTRDEGRVTITCTCPEGMRGQFCEHKFRLASNDIMMLQHPGQNSDMLNAHIWVIESPMSDKILELLNLLGEDKPDENAMERLKGEVGAAMRGE